MDIGAYTGSLFCDGCLVVAAAVVVRLRFAVENIPAKGALGSSCDESFIVTVCRSYYRDLKQVGPFFYEHFKSKCWVMWSSSSWSEVFQQWNVRRPSWGCAACLVAEISQWQTLSNKILREVWYMSNKVAGDSQSWQEEQVEGQGGVVGGRVDIYAVVVEGGNGICFCLHFIPFLMVPF